MKKIVIGAALGLSFSGLILGCEMISSTESVHIDFSSLGLLPDSWYISCFDGEIEQRIVQDGREKSLSVIVEKNTPIGILVYPVVSSVKGRPLGALYPFQSEISETGGFVAYIAERLYRGSENDGACSRDYLARFNWPKFIEICNEVDDPWKLDSERIISAIASGTFKKSDIKIKKK